MDRPTSRRAARTEKIRDSVRQVFLENHAIYGPAKIARELANRDELESACRNTVAEAMQELGLKSRVCKGFRPTTTQTDPLKQPASIVVERDCAVARPRRPRPSSKGVSRRDAKGDSSPAHEATLCADSP